MEEIEVKILDIDREKVEERLISLGAKKIFDGEIEQSLFDFPDKSIRNNGETLRLRKLGDRIFLSFKKHISKNSAKIMEEHEVEVSDFDKTKRILESIGLSEWLNMKKHRTSYVLDDVRFDFDKYHDQYEFVPEFLEIEAKDIETVYRYAELIGFKKEDCKAWTFKDVVDAIKKGQ